jgi:hypothetical protein
VADKEFRILAAPFVGTCMLELPKGPSFPQPIPIAIAPSAGMSRSSETDMATYASTINNQMQAALSNVAAGLGQSIQLPLGSSKGHVDVVIRKDISKKKNYQ